MQADPKPKKTLRKHTHKFGSNSTIISSLAFRLEQLQLNSISSPGSTDDAVAVLLLSSSQAQATAASLIKSYLP